MKLQDIMKEVEAWKRGLISDENNVVRKGNEAILETYNHSLKRLFRLYYESHREFNDLFGEIDVQSRINHDPRRVPAVDFFESWGDIIRHFETVNEMGLTLRYRDFLFAKADSDPFNEQVCLEVIFNEFDYAVTDGHDNGREYFRKSYSERLSAQEIQDFVSDRVRDLFEKIKTDMEVKRHEEKLVL